jgi:hypothetical protein
MPVHCRWDKRSESLRAYCVRNTIVALTFIAISCFRSHCSFLAVESRWCHASRYRLEEQPVDLEIVRVDQLSFLSRLDPEDGRVLVSVFPHIIKYQLRLARSTKPLAARIPVVDRVLSPIVWLFFDLSVQVGMDPNCLWLNLRGN